MEFNSEIASFQGAIISADNVHQFSTLASKGGNEEKVKYVIESIRRFLKMENYIDDSGLSDSKKHSTRKFALYIILNTYIPVLDDMRDIADLEPLIWSLPTVPKYLMCEMMWRLHFEKYIYEMIPASWPQLGIEVAEAFIENFKYLYPTECLHRLYKLSAASYALICRLANFKYQDNDTLTSTTNAAFTNLQNILKYYTNPPNKHRLDTLSTDDLYKYKGQRLKTLLHLVYDCFCMFNQNVNTSCDDPVYKLTYHEDYLHNITCKVYESPNKPVVECLNNSNIVLLDVFQEIVMDVSVNIFCAWSEYEEDGKSFQQIIGELCHKVQEMLESISLVAEHPVISMIRLMARKPTDIKDIINETDGATILQKINLNDNQSPAWIRALAYYEHLYQDFQLLRIVDSNVNVYEKKECYKMLKNLNKTTIDNFNDQQFLIRLRVQLLSGCDVSDKHKILKKQFVHQILRDSERVGDDFNVELNGMFNKFIADVDNADLTGVLTAFYQNPRKVYDKIFNLASRNSELIDSMLRLMIHLQDYSRYFYESDTEPCMITVMKKTLASCTDASAYSSNVIKFIGKLKENKVITHPHLLLLIIMPGIHSSIVSEDTKQLRNYVQLLVDSFNMEELTDYRAPMLVTMGQIMNKMRFRNVSKFHIEAIQTLELAIRFQKSVINTYRDVIPDIEGSWLRTKVRELNLQPLNVYYYKSLWNVDNRSFFDTITGKRLSKEVPFNELAIMLAKILPLSTLDEWFAIWDDIIALGFRDVDALRMMHSTVAALSDTITKFRTQRTRACILYCFTNLMQMMRYRMLKDPPLTNWLVKNCVAYLARTLTTTHPDDVGQIETIIMPFMAYLSSRKYDHTLDVPRYFTQTRYHEFICRFFTTENEVVR